MLFFCELAELSIGSIHMYFVPGDNREAIKIFVKKNKNTSRIETFIEMQLILLNKF